MSTYYYSRGWIDAERSGEKGWAREVRQELMSGAVAYIRRLTKYSVRSQPVEGKLSTPPTPSLPRQLAFDYSP